jgi:hypothetical protein
VLDQLLRLRGVTWRWREDGSADAGVIAQEVEAVFPGLVLTGADGIKRVNYTGLVALLVEAVRELHARVTELERR